MAILLTSEIERTVSLVSVDSLGVDLFSSFGFSAVLGCSLGTFASCSSSRFSSLTAVSFSFFTCSFFSCFLLCLGFSSVLGGVLLVCLSVFFLISFLGASLLLFSFTATDFLIISKISPECLSILILYFEFS